MGNNVHFQPRVLPSDPKYIKIGNNVTVASGVDFVTHDVIHFVFNNLSDGEFKSHLGCIEICDNVFIGANAIIMPNVKIGPNAIVAAGTIVTKDVQEGVIVGGSPARIIGKFNDLFERRRLESLQIFDDDRMRRVENEWKLFNEQRKR